MRNERRGGSKEGRREEGEWTVSKEVMESYIILP